MARILILQEQPGPHQALSKSLTPYHELIFVNDTCDALRVLQNTMIDLIISRVHLEHGSVFEFIHAIKQTPSISHIPLICFCGRLTQTARVLNDTLARSAVTMGANKYLSLSRFCANEDCDFDRLRQEIESVLSKTCHT